MIKDRDGNILPDGGGQERFLSLLYRNKAFFPLLKLLSRRFIANLGRAYMSSPLSRRRIAKTVKSAGINMDDYEEREYRSFNDFFTRRIKPGARPIDLTDGAFVAPADSKLTALDITGDSVYRIKDCDYSVRTLIGDEEEAKNYFGGKCFIFRLTVDNYHRYCYPCSGRELYHKFIPGVLHTVNPVAFEKHDVFGKNCRELTVVESDLFGRMAIVEVGAMMVGRINNVHRSEFAAGDEKGFFSFGGSTIVVLCAKGAVTPDGDITANSLENVETAVRYGEKVGTAGVTE